MKVDGPFMVDGIMVDRGVEEGDVGQTWRWTEGSGVTRSWHDTQEKEN
jgi:hypothetical protein